MEHQPGSTSKQFGLPEQHNLQTATDNAMESLRSQSDEQLGWLGARVEGSRLRLKVLEAELSVDMETGRIATDADAEVCAQWRILVLHYLCITAKPEQLPPEVTFADLSGARSYAGIYNQRVIGRLCATAGRNEQALRTGADALDAQSHNAGDVGFDLKPFPLVTARIIWHAPDEEFGSSATMLFPRNIESFFCSEDIIVLSEQMVSRLSGRPF